MFEFASRTNLLELLESKDYIKFGNISADWASIIDECEHTAAQHDQYWSSLVLDRDQYESWDQLGDQYIDGVSLHQQWGYNKHNTRTWETTAKQPQIVMPWEEKVINSLPLRNATSRPTLQPPGNVMPWHKDEFYYFKRQYPQETKFIVRFLVLMKDWEVGHLLQAGNSIISHWKAGDVILWHPDRMHLGANVGITNKWTQTVTGVLTEH